MAFIHRVAAASNLAVLTVTVEKAEKDSYREALEAEPDTIMLLVDLEGAEVLLDRVAEPVVVGGILEALVATTITILLGVGEDRIIVDQNKAIHAATTAKVMDMLSSLNFPIPLKI